MSDIMELINGDPDYYSNVLSSLRYKTDGFSRDSGVVKLDDFGDLVIAKKILQDHYNNVDGRDPEEDNEYDLSYHVRYSGPIDESLENHKELNQDIFDGDEMRPEVLKKLLEIVDKFKEKLQHDDIDLKIVDVQVVGSNASYNYTDTSDIDLHILADLSIYEGKEDLAEKLYNAYKSLFNGKYDPTIYGHEVEVYVEHA